MLYKEYKELEQEEKDKWAEEGVKKTIGKSASCRPAGLTVAQHDV
jgi:hypothetical protein